VVNAIAHIHIKPPRLTKQRFVAGGAAAVAVADELLLGIRLRLHSHAPQQLATFLEFHQQAAHQLGGNELGGAGEEGWGEGLEGLRGRGGYGSGFETCLLSRLIIGPKKHPWKQGAEYNLINARASAVFLRASMFACFCQVRGCIHAISKRKPAFRSCKIQC